MSVSALDAAVRRISTSLLDARPDVLGAAISDALRELCETIDVDRGYILATQPDTFGVEVLENWWRPGVEQIEATPIPELPIEAQRFWARGLRKGRPIAFDDFDEVPVEATEAVADLIKAKVASIVLIPLTSSQGTLGFTGFEARRHAHQWTDEETAVLRTVGEMLLITIDRCRAERERLQAVTDLAARNRDLERSNRDLEQFASIVSHDLKSPLMQIDGFVALLAKSAGDPSAEEMAQSAAAAARRGIERMARLIDDLLAYSRAGGGLTRHEPVALSELAAELAGEVAAAVDDAAANLTIGDLPVVQGDSTQLRQLLQNVVANAIKFHRPGQPATVTLDATRDGAVWRIVVADDGIGIDAASREEIFEMFRRGASGGTPGAGIGLAIAKRVVDNHDGRIWVEDNPGGGTRLVFELPVGEL